MIGLFTPVIGMRQLSHHWWLTRDGDNYARELFDRHYSRRHYKDGRDPKIFVGPGEKLVLINETASALFIWRKFLCDIQPPQAGVNCAVFRNECATPSSLLISEAEGIAWDRWPKERLWTLVNASKIRSTNPGMCFLAAGWRRDGLCKTGKLIFSKTPCQ